MFFNKHFASEGECCRYFPLVHIESEFNGATDHIGPDSTPLSAQVCKTIALLAANRAAHICLCSQKREEAPQWMPADIFIVASFLPNSFFCGIGLRGKNRFEEQHMQSARQHQPQVLRNNAGNAVWGGKVVASTSSRRFLMA